MSSPNPEIPLVELEGKLQAAIAAVPSARRCALYDREAQNIEQMAGLVPDADDHYHGFVLVYGGSTSDDAPEKGSMWLVVRHRWKAVGLMTVHQERESDGLDSEVALRAMVEDTRRALVPKRSFEYGTLCVKHGFLQVPTDFYKQPTERRGDLMVAPCTIVIAHWYYQWQC